MKRKFNKMWRNILLTSFSLVGIFSVVSLITSCSNSDTNQLEFNQKVLNNVRFGYKKVFSNATEAEVLVKNADALFDIVKDISLGNQNTVDLSKFSTIIDTSTKVENKNTTITWDSNNSSTTLDKKILTISGFTAKVDGGSHILKANLSLKNVDNQQTEATRVGVEVFNAKKLLASEVSTFLDKIVIPKYDQKYNELKSQEMPYALAIVNELKNTNSGSSSVTQENFEKIKKSCDTIASTYQSAMTVKLTDAQLSEVKNEITKNGDKNIYTTLHKLSSYFWNINFVDSNMDIITTELHNLSTYGIDSKIVNQIYEPYLKEAYDFYHDYWANLINLLKSPGGVSPIV